jgi:hypothetical protein
MAFTDRKRAEAISLLYGANHFFSKLIAFILINRTWN